MSKGYFEATIKPIRLHLKYNPPVIAVQYKNKESDTKSRLYSILLRELVLNRNTQQVANKLYQQHPHILNQKVIPKNQIRRLVQIIQQNLSNEQQDEEFDLNSGTKQKQIRKHNNQMMKNKDFDYQFDDDDDDFEQDSKLNKSL